MACFKATSEVESSREYFFGRINGTSAPYCNATSLMSISRNNDSFDQTRFLRCFDSISK